MGTQLPLPQRGTAPPIFGPYLLRLNGCIAQDTTWYGGRPASAQVTVRWGPSYPQKKGLCLLWRNGWMDQNATWYRGKRQLRRRCVIWGRSSPPKRDTARQWSAHVYCGQTAGWIQRPLGTEVDMGPGHIVLDGVPAPRERGTAAPPLFDPCLLWPWSPISVTAELLYMCSVYYCILHPCVGL